MIKRIGEQEVAASPCWTTFDDQCPVGLVTLDGFSVNATLCPDEALELADQLIWAAHVAERDLHDVAASHEAEDPANDSLQDAIQDVIQTGLESCQAMLDRLYGVLDREDVEDLSDDEIKALKVLVNETQGYAGSIILTMTYLERAKLRKGE